MPGKKSAKYANVKKRVEDRMPNNTMTYILEGPLEGPLERLLEEETVEEIFETE